MRRSTPHRFVLGLLAVLGIGIAASDTLSAAPREASQARVSLQEHDITLSELLKRVGREVGLEYTVHPDAEWHHVAVFCAGIPVKDVHAALQQTLMWDITREKESDTRFRAAPSLRRAALQREHLQRCVEGYRSDLESALQLAAQEREQPGTWEKTTKNIGLGIGAHRELFQFLGALPPTVLRSVLNGETARFSFSALDSELRGTLVRAYQAANPNVASDYGSPHQIELSLVREVNGVPQHLDVTYQFGKPEQRVHLYTGHLSTLRLLTGRQPHRDRLDQPKRSAEDLKRLDGRVGQVPPLPPGKLPRTATEVSVSLLDFHRRTGYHVLADVYPHWRTGGLPTEPREPRPVLIEGLSIAQAIGAIGETQDYAAAVQGRSAHFRSHWWASSSILEKVYHPKPEPPEAPISCCN